MAPYPKSEEDRGSGGIHDVGRSEKISYTLRTQERELPPLPDDAGYSDDEILQPPNTLAKFSAKSSPSASLIFTPSLSTPSTHDVILPIVPPRSSSIMAMRPKLHLDTGWDAPPRPAYLREIHSAGDITSRTSLSTPSSSRKGSIDTSASSQDKLLYDSPDHDSEPEDPPYHRPSISSIPDVTVTKPSSSLSRNNNAKSAPCFRSAMRLLAKPKLSSLVQTKRAVNASSSSIDSIRAKPFIRSDPCNPLQGITITVQRQHLVSAPMPELFSGVPNPEAFGPSPSSSATSLLSVASISSSFASRVSLVDYNLDKPLPIPAEEDLLPTPAEPKDQPSHPHLPTTGNHIDSGVFPIPHDDHCQRPTVIEADDDPFADAFPATSDTDSESDQDSEPELVEFKSRLSVTVTPATATRLHVPGKHLKRRKRYSSRPQTADSAPGTRTAQLSA